jgi:hypothetical protein
MLAYSSGSFYVNAKHVQQAAEDSHQTKTPLLGVAGVLRQLVLIVIISNVLQPISQGIL